MQTIDYQPFRDFLQRTWFELNQTYLHNRLTPPNFALTSGLQRLGSWQPETRTLSLSMDYMMRYTAEEVRDVIRHEMAHQFADEVLSARDETPHGSGFRYACDLLGIGYAARQKEGTSDNPVVARIRKLLALAESDNVHEAEVAMTRARALMVKHQLTFLNEEEPLFQHRYLMRTGSRRPAVLQMLSGILIRFFNVRIVWVHTQALRTGKDTWLMEASGCEQHLDIAAYVLHYLNRELEVLWSRHRARHPLVKGAALKRDFQIGILRGLSMKLDEQMHQEQSQDKATGNAHALIRKMDARLGDFVSQRHPSLRNGRPLTFRMSQTYREGVAHGKKLNIRQGLTNKDKAVAALGSGG